MTLILWDIDGTLVRGRGQRVTLNAFVDALKLVSNLTEIEYPKDSHGKTDHQIALEMLLAASIEEQEAAQMLPIFGKAYAAALHDLREHVTEDLEVLPGVRELLPTLQERGVRQSLLTGNLEPVARLKLACAGLDHFLDFEVGAFGSDHRDRSELVPIVRSRLSRAGHDDVTDIVVVGDTPRDIACARAGHARAIAVATGNFSRQELEAHAPDAAFDDLSDTQRVIDALLRYSSYADTTALIV